MLLSAPPKRHARLYSVDVDPAAIAAPMMPRKNTLVSVLDIEDTQRSPTSSPLRSPQDDTVTADSITAMLAPASLSSRHRAAAVVHKYAQYIVTFYVLTLYVQVFRYEDWTVGVVRRHVYGNACTTGRYWVHCVHHRGKHIYDNPYQ